MIINPPVTAVVGARLFDGERTADDATVLIQADRILSVDGPGSAVPADAHVIPAAGHTLMPGLIDAHVHADLAGLRSALRFGVTTVLELQGHWTAAERTEIGRADDLADLRSAGYGITAPGGHPSQYYPDSRYPGVGEVFRAPFASDPGQAREVVRNLVRTGSDFIKIYIEDGAVVGRPGLAVLDAGTVAAAVEEAHDHGKVVIAHALTASAARTAVDAGVDGLAHLFVDRPATPADVQAIRDAGVFVVPCLTMNASLLGTTFPEGRWADVTTSLAALHSAGVELLVGTDANPHSPGVVFGASLHDELRLLVAAGLSPAEALRAATSATADRFGLTDRGRVRAGLRADLVLAAGDPTRAITGRLPVSRIWREGRLLPG